jgi:hypothetical protein
MGIRFNGPKPTFARADGGEGGSHPSNVHDHIYAIGAVNFTGDMPIVLGLDGPSLGGFVCAATVVSSELWKMGQVGRGGGVGVRRFGGMPASWWGLCQLAAGPPLAQGACCTRRAARKTGGGEGGCPAQDGPGPWLEAAARGCRCLEPATIAGRMIVLADRQRRAGADARGAGPWCCRCAPTTACSGAS